MKRIIFVVVFVISLFLVTIIFLSSFNQTKNVDITEEVTETESAQEPATTAKEANAYTLRAGDYEFSVSHQGKKRIYLVHVPPSYTISSTMPAVLMLHGGGGNAEGTIPFSGFLEKADKEGFILVHPEGTTVNPIFTKSLTWNAGVCEGIPNTKCGVNAGQAGVDDVGYIHKVLDDLEEKFNVNTKRIYATGFSNGGQMSHRLGCEMSERLAAIAPVGGTLLYSSCNPTRAIPVLNIYMRNDENVPYEGGQGMCTNILGGDLSYTSVAYTVDVWKEKNRVSSSPVNVYENGTAHCEAYRRAGTEVQLCTIEEDPNNWKLGGHSWPGAPIKSVPIVCPLLLAFDCACVSTDDLDATDYIWDFFKKYSL